MNSFGYKVSVIVPVYNVERYLPECLDSLMRQTIAPDDMEVVIVNDGSPDNSEAICLRYAEAFPNVHYYRKENGGLSSARNYGIDRAQGEYLMYLDSDDSLSPEVVEACVAFFDDHHEEVDLVTFKDQPYHMGKKQALHYRYGVLKTTGIYDLVQYPFIAQTRINICTKNLGNENVRFDETPHFRHEDQAYCSAILKQRMRLGFVDQGEYRYRKDNEDSIRARSFTPIELFETTTAWFENMFGQFSDEVPEYYQSLLVNDLGWKVAANILWPYHYSPAEFGRAQERISNLLSRVSATMILNHPGVDSFHKHYLLTLKPNLFPAMVAQPDSTIETWAGGQKIHTQRDFEIILTRAQILDGALELIGYVKSALFSHITDDVAVVAVLGKDGSEQYLKTWMAADSSYHCRTVTNRFLAFRYQSAIEDGLSLRLFVEIRGVRYPTRYWCEETSPFRRGNAGGTVDVGDMRLTLVNGVFSVSRLNTIAETGNRFDELRASDPSLYVLVRAALEMRNVGNTWMYVDDATYGYDNAYCQFEHDIRAEDGIERFYVVGRQANTDVAEAAYPGRVVAWGSEMHRLLYLGAAKVLTAFVGPNTVSPFSASQNETLKAFRSPETVYLQHGILHASYETLYSADRACTNRIVVSSPWERQNLLDRYHYQPDDLIVSGQPRFGRLDRTIMPQRKILFAPSWRAYFASKGATTEWSIQREALLSSNYFTGLSTFLNSEELRSLLDETDYILEFKPHPSLLSVRGLFEVSNPRIKVVGSVSAQEDYSIFVTDFSSYQFDFVYLKRPVVYFVPDFDEFRSGMNSYRDLDLPFDQAFGPLTLDPREAVTELSKILDNGCEMGSPYGARADAFFYHGKDVCQATLQAVRGDIASD